MSYPIFYAEKENKGIFIQLSGYPMGEECKVEDVLRWTEEGDIDKVLENIDKKWNGCYSLIVRNQDMIYAFTDPFGIEQMYYSLPVPGHKDAVFSNLMKDLVKDKIDYQYISEINKWGYNTDNRTPWTNIKRVMPGTCYAWSLLDHNGAELKVFDDYFEKETEALHFANKDAAMRYLLSASVHAQVSALPEDTKNIGVLLSGGLDSSCVAYELIQMQKNGELGDKQLKFYTINNAEDAPFVKIYAEQFGINVETLSYDISKADISEALMINETPVDLGSMVPNQQMFKIIPEKILFTGDGPDEMLGGYNRIDQYDSQLSDMFEELSFYHFPRLRKAASFYNKMLCCPYLDRSIVSFALSLPIEERTHKKVLKDAYRGLIPDAIIERKKLPLKNDRIRKDPMEYRFELVKTFIADNKHSECEN